MTIVILDNSVTVRTRINELLLEVDSENLDIELYEDAEDVLDFMEDNEVDLLFSSIETVGIDGVSFVDSLLRKDPSFVSKLFIVTSHNNSETFEEMKDVGAKRFIKKPINEEYFKHFVIPEIDKILNH